MRKMMKLPIDGVDVPVDFFLFADERLVQSLWPEKKICTFFQELQIDVK